MRIFIFDWPDRVIRRALLGLLGDDLYQFRPLQKYLSTGYHVISFYLAVTTAIIITSNLLEWLWQIIR